MEIPNTHTEPTPESLSQSLNEACEAQDRYFTAAKARVAELEAKVREDQHKLACLEAKNRVLQQQVAAFLARTPEQTAILEDEPWLVSLVKFTARNGDTIAGSLPSGTMRSQVEAFSRDARVAVGACK